MERTKKNIMILCYSFAMICAVTFSARFIKYIDILALGITLQVLLNILNGIIAFVAMKQTKMTVEIDLRNKKQYIIGVGIAIALSIVIAVIPALCGVSLVGGHTDFSWFIIIYDLFFYMLIIGPVEEFIFRVYLQDVFVGFFNTRKWLGVIIAALLFGLLHIINGNIIQVQEYLCRKQSNDPSQKPLIQRDKFFRLSLYPHVEISVFLFSHKQTGSCHSYRLNDKHSNNGIQKIV